MRSRILGGVIAATAAACLTMVAGTGSAFAASGPIRIGVQAPITGAFAAEGQGIENAVKLLVKEQNAKGGLLGRKIEVSVCDDEGQASQAAICARKLVNDGVTAVIGSYASGEALAAGAIYAQSNVIQTSDGTANELVHRGWKTFFRNAPANGEEAKFTAHYFVKVKHYKRIAILSDHSSYATALAADVIKDIKALHGNIVDRSFIDAGTQNYTATLTHIKSKDPDVLYYAGYYSDGGLVRAQMVQLNMKATFVGSDANQNSAFAKIAGDAAPGSVMINVPPPDDLPYPAAKAFTAAYKAAYGSDPPSIFTYTNADGLRGVFAAIEATKSTDPTKLEAWMHDMPKPLDGLTGPFKWSSDGERVGSPMSAFVVQPGGGYKVVYSESTKA
ncbi:MAG TPA: branched-chain amino acid ABC transporter substrate-binding protein [Nevskiaceae bacterium]